MSEYTNPDGTWQSIAPEETLRLLEFIDALPWPMPRPDAKQHLVDGLGWTLNDKGFVDNNVSGLNWPDVSINAVDDDTTRVGFNISDLERGRFEDPEWVVWRDDLFALTVRHLSTVWGAPRLHDDDEESVATWERPSGGRVNVAKDDKAVTVGYVTPFMAEIERGKGW